MARQIRTDQDAIEWLAENHPGIAICETGRGQFTSEIRECRRCGGSGIFHWISMGRRVAGGCFGCGGRNTEKLIHTRVLKRARQLRNNETARLRKEKKSRDRVAANTASANALFEDSGLLRFDAFIAKAYPSEEAADGAREGRDRHALNILQDLDRKAQTWGSISENQIALYSKLANQITDAIESGEASAEAKVATPEGRHEITGKIISIKHSDGEWGITCRMTIKVETDAGIWIGNGTLPRKVYGQFDGDTENLVGRTITLTATIERSDRDDAFGFLKRPGKAMLATEGGAGCSSPQLKSAPGSAPEGTRR